MMGCSSLGIEETGFLPADAEKERNTCVPFQCRRAKVAAYQLHVSSFFEGGLEIEEAAWTLQHALLSSSPGTYGR